MFQNDVETSPLKDRNSERSEPAVFPQRNVLVAGFEKAVQLFAPVEESAAQSIVEEPIPAAGTLRAGYDFNWELEYLASSTQPFTFKVTPKPVSNE